MQKRGKSMKFQYLGTAAAEDFPAVFCNCEYCQKARELGGKFLSADDYAFVFDRISSELGANVAENLHCHFSKIEWTGSGEKKHLTFEDNLYGPDFEPLIDVIIKEKLSPTIICESAGTQAEDAKAMKDYYLKISK